MSLETIAKGSSSTLTNPLTATVGVAFPTGTVVMKDPAIPLNGGSLATASLRNRIFVLRAAGTFLCSNGTTPSLTCQVYVGGVAGTQLMTTGAVAVGGTQPSSGSWLLEGRFMWDAVSGINGVYWGYLCGQNSISTLVDITAIANISATAYPTNVTFTATGLFSATGSANTVTLSEIEITYA